MRRRFLRALARQDWIAVAIELAVVVIGILVALQVSQWAEVRQERGMERVYLSRLKEDLQIERQRALDAEGFAKNRLAAVQLLDRMTRNPDLAGNDPNSIPWAIETASWRSFPKINDFVYNELQNTGRMSLIRSVPLRRALAEHYADIAHDGRVGEDRSAEQDFDLAAAGVLNVAELSSIERVGGDPRRIAMDKSRARAVIKAFIGRPAAVAQLPSLAQHHLFNLRVIGDMIARTDRLIAMIDDQLGERAPSDQ